PELQSSRERFCRGEPQGLIVGDVTGKAAEAEAVAADLESRELLDRLIESRDLLSLGRIWVALPVEIDWVRLHRGRPVRRVSLPTYPFARQRLWPGRDANAPGV